MELDGAGCSTQIEIPFEEERTVTLTAVPDAQSVFSGWRICSEGECDGRDGAAQFFTFSGDGTVTLTVTFDIAVSTVASVELTPDPITLDLLGPPGAEISATVLDTNDNPVSGAPLTWESSDQNVATVTPAAGEGMATVTAVGPGSATITATSDNDVSGSTSVTVAGLADLVISSDMETESDWSQTLRGATGGATSSSTHESSGGYEGAYRRIQHDMPGSSSVNYFHAFDGVTYDPSIEGAITSLRLSEFRKKFAPAGSAEIGATFAVMQGGTIHPHTDGENVLSEDWTYVQTDFLTSGDFSGGSGPDFSASGGPITFGFIRSNTNTGTSTLTLVHGVDNFRVEIRR